MEKKEKRYYKVGELIWAIPFKKMGFILSIDKEKLKVVVVLVDDPVGYTLDLWQIDKFKEYSNSEKPLNEKQNKKMKHTYFASVNGGIIPTKNNENAGRDAYCRIEPVDRGGKNIYEMYLPKMQLSKIPLGFASYLQKEDVLSLNWERSSVGKHGILVMSGCIDSSYQGEVILQVIPLLHDVLITNEVNEVEYDEIYNIILYPHSKAIAQAVVLKQSDAKDLHISYDELLSKPSMRKLGNEGSSGK
jgi:dUTPase